MHVSHGMAVAKLHSNGRNANPQLQAMSKGDARLDIDGGASPPQPRT